MKVTFFLGSPSHNKTDACDSECEADEALEMEDWISDSYESYFAEMFAKVGGSNEKWPMIVSIATTDKDTIGTLATTFATLPGAVFSAALLHGLRSCHRYALSYIVSVHLTATIVSCTLLFSWYRASSETVLNDLKLAVVGIVLVFIYMGIMFQSIFIACCAIYQVQFNDPVG